ncbi:hypothetical protein [Streptococcus gallolyticus]|uniref:hypothetical protein n=1 Tax=Streptococcus gallolyticus TaxID=315405 RepID=UPI002284C36D|nr:hypothetical protein [Streptococcus gallolyticus]MCY7192641.1 hypothetical protein [Streptococcus gallolyticus subsp. gallolyticus]
MTLNEFYIKLDTIKEKISVLNIKPRKKFLGQFTFGYYYDKSIDKYIVYEVTERQQFLIWEKTETEENALDELFDIIKFNVGIRD